jgi:hypothetical protein
VLARQRAFIHSIDKNHSALTPVPHDTNQNRYLYRWFPRTLPGFFASQEMDFMYTYTKNHQRGRKAVSVELESGIPSMQGICADPGQGSQPSAHPRQHAPCSQGLSLCPRISARCHFGSNQSDISLGISFRIESERHLLGQFLAKLFPSHLKVLELRPRGEVSGPRVVLRNRIEKVLRLRF